VRIGAVDPGSPAKQADLEAEDIVLRTNGTLVTSMQSLQDAIRGSGGAPVKLEVLRDARLLALAVTPAERPIQTEQGTETHYGIGVRLGPVDSGAELRDDVVKNPFVALYRGAQKTGEMVVAIAGGIASLVTGSVGINSLSGPIGIGEIAADAYKSSWNQFVLLMAAISVNLALLNLLPIPVLDGGQIVLAAAEGIKGSPLPARARDIAQTVGLSLILLLMGVAFWNDIARHWSGMVEFLSSTLG
jgi:regulator of sigma E protease